MKKQYTIGEICQLYGLGADSLRYYEKKGLIHPKRLDNGYRVYHLDEIWRLNIIKNLRKLDFSVDQIKMYLENRTLDSTVELIEKEIEIIEKEIEPLLALKNTLEKKREIFHQLKNVAIDGEVRYQQLEERRIIFVEKSLSKDEEVDLAFRELEKTDDAELSLLGNQDMGVLVAEKGLEKKDYTLYQKAFFFVQDPQKPYHMSIAPGDYATLLYRGSYLKSQRMFEKVVRDIENKGFLISGHAMEIYRLDIHSTSETSEFITEIQIPVKRTLD